MERFLPVMLREFVGEANSRNIIGRNYLVVIFGGRGYCPSLGTATVSPTIGDRHFVFQQENATPNRAKSQRSFVL